MSLSFLKMNQFWNTKSSLASLLGLLIWNGGKKTIEIHKIISDNCMQHILDQAALGILVWRKRKLRNRFNPLYQLPLGNFGFYIRKSTSRCFNEWTIVVEWIEIGLTDTVSFHTTTKNILFSSTEVRAYLIFEWVSWF